MAIPGRNRVRLHLLKVHLPYHESDHVLNLAYNVLAGGRCRNDARIERIDIRLGSSGLRVGHRRSWSRGHEFCGRDLKKAWDGRVGDGHAGGMPHQSIDAHHAQRIGCGCPRQVSGVEVSIQISR